MNLLKEFKKFSKSCGYPRFQDALSHIAFLRTFEDDSLIPKENKQAQPSVFYWKFLSRLPCTGCGSPIGSSPRYFSDKGEPTNAIEKRITYFCVPVCSDCFKRPEVLLAIKVRFQDIVLSLLVTYIRCIEGT
jgi:hypothetical protein